MKETFFTDRRIGLNIQSWGETQTSSRLLVGHFITIMLKIIYDEYYLKLSSRVI